MEKISKNKLLMILAVVLFVAIALVLWQGKTFKKLTPGLVGGKIVEETLSIPNMTSTSAVDGRSLRLSEFLTPLVPKSDSDQIIVPMAKLTLKQGLEIAQGHALRWSDDVKLVYAKSFGAVTLDGKSSQWLYVFASAKKGFGLGVVIREKDVIADLELETKEPGHDLPVGWHDVNGAIFSLANSPDFSNRSIGGLSLYYNEDSGAWSFGIALDKGQSTAVPLK